MNPAIGLMSPTENHIVVLDEESGIYETGNWVISTSRIADLKQKDLVIVKGSKKPAYIGGKILSYTHVRTDVDKLGREKKVWSLTFKKNEKYVGYTGHYDKWKGRCTVRYFT